MQTWGLHWSIDQLRASKFIDTYSEAVCVIYLVLKVVSVIQKRNAKKKRKKKEEECELKKEEITLSKERCSAFKIIFLLVVSQMYK